MVKAWLLLAALHGQTGLEGSTGTLEAMACPDASILGSNLVSDVCWDCLFPIRIAGATLGSSGNRAPARAASSSFCYCPDEGIYGKYGVTVGFWQPVRLIETVRRPWCFPALGGMQASGMSTAVGKLQFGRNKAQEGGPNEQKNTFHHFHYYAFPLITMLGMFDAQECIDGDHADIDLMFFSEAIPHWADDTLAFQLTPEAAMFGNPAAAAAMPLECAKIAAGGEPIDALFWVAGCWGSNYPMTGHVIGGSSPVRTASLASTRGLFLLTRLGLISRRMGDDAVCQGWRDPVLTKSQFRQQWIFPLPEASVGGNAGPYSGGGTAQQGSGGGYSIPSSNPVCCHPIGDPTLQWGEWRTLPGVGEESIILLWKWVDCCVGVTF